MYIVSRAYLDHVFYDDVVEMLAVIMKEVEEVVALEAKEPSGRLIEA